MDEQRKIIAVQKNTIAELRKEIEKQQKRCTQILHENKHLKEAMKNLTESQKLVTEAFKKRHSKTINNILEMVQGGDFVSLDGNERKKLVEREYLRTIIG